MRFGKPQYRNVQYARVALRMDAPDVVKTTVVRSSMPWLRTSASMLEPVRTIVTSIAGPSRRFCAIPPAFRSCAPGMWPAA
jgi:hypothetical protein